MPRIRSLGITSIILTLCCAAPLLAQGGPPASRVRVDAARIEPVEQRREVTGEFRPVQFSRLAAESEGLVTHMLVDAGDHIEAGDVIARLDETRANIEVARYSAEVDSARATISLREAELEKARRDVQRLEQAQAQSGASINEVDDARTAAKAATARLAEARASALVAEQNLADAEQRLSDMTIRAPFSGTIITKSTEVGEWIGEGDTVAEIIALDTLDAILDVPQQYLPVLTPGSSTITIVVEALAEERTALVRSIIPRGNELARTFPVRVRMDNPGEQLRPGMSVIGLIPTGQTAASLTVHKDALLRDDAGTFVYMAVGDQAMPARVRPLFAVGNRIVIESATVSEGTPLVVEGNERLYPTAKLNIMNPPAKANSNPGS